MLEIKMNNKHYKFVCKYIIFIFIFFNYFHQTCMWPASEFQK